MFLIWRPWWWCCCCYWWLFRPFFPPFRETQTNRTTKQPQKKESYGIYEWDSQYIGGSFYFFPPNFIRFTIVCYVLDLVLVLLVVVMVFLKGLRYDVYVLFTRVHRVVTLIRFQLYHIDNYEIIDTLEWMDWISRFLLCTFLHARFFHCWCLFHSDYFSLGYQNF